MKFIHAADIHLDSPLGGLSRYEGAPAEAMRNATRRAFENLVSFAIEERVDFMLIAGDLYDTDWKDYNTGLFFNRCMVQLQQAGIPVLMVRGNHDAGSHITRQLKLPDNVTDFQTDKAHVVRLDDLGVAVHGQGYLVPAVMEDLARAYPDPLPGYFNIGLLHTSVDGRPGHASYAPCSLQGLVGKGYDYWALGHVHRREVLHQEPWIVFPGNLQGRHARETGPKGCTLVTVQDGRVQAATHRCMDVMRWARCAVDAIGVATAEELLDRIGVAMRTEMQTAEGRPLALRIEVLGACPAHAVLQRDEQRWINEIRALALEVGGGLLWVEKVKLSTRAAVALEELIGQGGALGELLRGLRNLRDDADALHALAHEFQDLRNRLPDELVNGHEPLDPSDPALIAQLLPEVEQHLIASLLDSGAA